MLQKANLLGADLKPDALWQPLVRILPGVLLCLLLTGIAYAIEFGERAGLGKAWLGAPVLALIIGPIWSAIRKPTPILQPGIRFSTKFLLEVAIVILGAALSAQAMAAVGPQLLAAIIIVVMLSIAATYGIARLLGLTWQTAVLIACGNSICGNSAIVAVAPVIGAKSHELATSIAFTAVVSVPVVIGLPLLAPLMQMSDIHYGVLAGLTVYAIPQVLAATAPLGAVAVDTGTIVKLVRVVMLGPVCVALALVMAARQRRNAEDKGAGMLSPTIIPWFVFGFVAMAAARSFGLIPSDLVPVLAKLSAILTVVALAGLGLGLDIRATLRTGPSVMFAVVLSVTALLLMSLAVIGIVNPG